MSNLEKIVLHPIRMRIIQLVGQQQATTVAALAGAMADIPRSTIYHHIGILCDSHILRIVREQKVRGTYEREYSLNYEQVEITEDDRKSTVLNTLLKLYTDFNCYFELPDTNPVRDQLFLSVNTLMLTDEEFESLKNELFSVIQKYMNMEGNQGRRQRRLSVISSPDKEEP